MAKAYVKHDYAVTGRDYVETEGGGGGGGGVNYSTDEQDTGLIWVDGTSHIFQKTYILETGSHATYTLDEAFTGELIRTEGQWTDSGSTRRPIPYFISANNVIVYTQSDQLKIQLEPEGASDIFVTVRYIKTE